jgi:Ca2+:H+ antiporter
VIRRVLFALLGLGPLTIALHYLVHPPETFEFILAALSLIPLAWLIGEATEHAAEHTGPGIGGFLNATFGNAPELIIALIAVNDGLTEVVRGSLSGSVIGNLLLVLGASLVAGGRGRLDRYSSFLSFGLIGFATLLFLIPSIPAWDGSDPDTDELAQVSAGISVVLLIVYVAVTWYSLRRHRTLHVASDEEIKGWSFRAALGVLALATVVTAFVAEILVGSLEVFADQVGLSEFFVSAVIVAIVGNAAEHGGAVVVAFRGKIALAAEIALASAAQVAVFLIPAVALLSWLIDPLSLSFRPIEIAALAGSLAFATIVLFRGESSRARGVALLVAYGAVALSFFLAGDREVATAASSASGINSEARATSSSSISRCMTARRIVGCGVDESPTPTAWSRAMASPRSRPSGSTSICTKFDSTWSRSTGTRARSSASASVRARAWSSASRSTWWSSA